MDRTFGDCRDAQGKEYVSTFMDDVHIGTPKQKGDDPAGDTTRARPCAERTDGFFFNPSVQFVSSKKFAILKFANHQKHFFYRVAPILDVVGSVLCMRMQLLN